MKTFKQYYRIYSFNVSRQIRSDHNIKFFNITTDIADTSSTAYALSSKVLFFNKIRIQ